MLLKAFMWLLLLFTKAKDKYTEIAVKFRDYEVKKYEHWLAETECTLPLLMKKHLLVMITSENQNQAELVCISRYLFAYNCYLVLC